MPMDLLRVPATEADKLRKRTASGSRGTARRPLRGGTHVLDLQRTVGNRAVAGRLVQLQRRRRRSTVVAGEPRVEYIGWGGGAPGGAGTSPAERMAIMQGSLPLPTAEWESDDAKWWFPRLPVVYNAFVVTAAPFTLAYLRVLQYNKTLGVPLNPAGLPDRIKHMLTLDDTSPASAREVHEATTQMASPDSTVEAAYRLVEAFQSRLLAFTNRLEVARTRMSEFETRQDIRRVQERLDEVRATKQLVDQLIGGAVSLIAMAGGLAGAYASPAGPGAFAKVGGSTGSLVGGGEVFGGITWLYFHGEIERYEKRIAELEQKRTQLEQHGLALELDIAHFDLNAVAKELEAKRISFQQAVIARRQQAATLGSALEAAHPRSTHKAGAGTMPAVMGMANAVREAAFFAQETRRNLEQLDLYAFVDRVRHFGYYPGTGDPVHRDSKRMWFLVGTLLNYKDLLWQEQPGLAAMAQAWTDVLGTPTGPVGGY
jgi:hypothetical protein